MLHYKTYSLRSHLLERRWDPDEPMFILDQNIHILWALAQRYITNIYDPIPNHIYQPITEEATFKKVSMGPRGMSLEIALQLHTVSNRGRRLPKPESYHSRGIPFLQERNPWERKNMINITSYFSFPKVFSRSD